MTHRTSASLLNRRALLISLTALATRTGALSASQLSPNTELVITPAELMTLMGDPGQNVRILDASPLRTYRANHLPGATHAFWQDTVDANYPVFGAVVTQGFDQQQRLRVLQRLGVEPADTIAVYDDEAGLRAARVVWFLRFLGYAGARLLDGGMQGWRAVGGATQKGALGPPGVDPVLAPQEGFYVVTEALAARLDRGDTDVIDIRSEAQRQDSQDGTLPLGTIPGARSWAWDTLIDQESNALLSLDVLHTQMAVLDLDPSRDIVVFGRFGVETGLSWLVLKLLGYDRVLTYDRGWVEWASTPDLPIEPLP